MTLLPQPFRLLARTLSYFLFLCGMVVLMGVAFAGVQWFSDSVQTIFSHKTTAQPNLFSAAVDVNASTQEAPAVAEGSDEAKPAPDPAPAPKPQGLQVNAALSVSVVNGTMNPVYEKNGDQSLPIASLTKLMSALLVLENDNLSQLVTVSPDAMAQEGEQGVLKLGESMPVKSLLSIMLIESSNRAAYALSEVQGPGNFIEMMNTRAAILGMTHTHFADAAGLSSQSYSSAHDLAILTQYLYDNFPLFREIISYKSYDLYVNGVFHHTLESTNKLLGVDNIVGGKTGFTNEAKGCFMAIVQNGTNYDINIVLGADDRFAQMQNLIGMTK